MSVKFPTSQFDLFYWEVNLPLSYLEWNRAIARHFFSKKSAGEAGVVYLALDEEILPQIAEEQIGVALDLESAHRDFVEAIRSWCVNPSNQVIMPSPGQKVQADLPSQIAFLGLLVLAASRMDDDEAGTKENYYLRLNDLLLNELREHSPQGFDERLNVRLWKDLRDWLGTQGLRLILPEREMNPHYSVEFIKSQALLKASDLFKMTHLFNMKNLYPGQRIGDAHLENLVSEWLSHTDCPISKHGQKVLKEQRKRYALQQIAYQLQNWDGSYPPDPQRADLKGARNLSAYLNVNIRGHGRVFELCYYLRCPDLWQERVAEKLEFAGGHWYGPLPGKLSLNNSYSDLPESDTPIRLRPNSKDSSYCVLVKNSDDELTGFMANGRHIIGDEILVLAKEAKTAPIGQVLQQLNAGIEVSVFPSRPELLQGWVTFRPFSVQCLAKNCPIELENLQPYQEITIRFEGGLKLGGTDWLKDALPRIKVLGAFPANRITINQQPTYLDESGYVKSVESLVNASGEYCVQVDGRVGRFFSLKSLQWPFTDSKLEENILWRFEVSADNVVKPIGETDKKDLLCLQIAGASVEGDLPEVEDSDEEEVALDFHLRDLARCEPDADCDWFVLASALVASAAHPSLHDMMKPLIDGSVQALVKSSLFYRTLLNRSLPKQKVKLSFGLAHLQLSDETQQSDGAK